MPKPVWFFDLDNTLHNASHAIFPAINANMNAFIAKTFSTAGLPCDTDSVNAARVDYLRRYGATLLGMIRHHQVAAADFLHEAHQFGDLASLIRAERGLGRLLRRLPGKKVLLTNAPRRYSHEVIRHLGLHRHLASHLPIESMLVHGRLRPKPSRALLRKLIAAEGVPARRCILVEDTVDNLRSAKALGMRTVWITQYLPRHQEQLRRPRLSHSGRAGYIDVKVKSVRQLPASLRRLT